MDRPIAALVPIRTKIKRPAGGQALTFDLTAARERLRTVFGFAEFRPGGEDGDATLFEALRRRRSELTKEQRVAAYVVFADKTLIDMARRQPATVAQMSALRGVGAAKLRQYGEVFLDVIRQHAAEQA